MDWRVLSIIVSTIAVDVVGEPDIQKGGTMGIKASLLSDG